MMAIQQLTSKEYFNKLKILFIALLAGQIIFALSVLVLIFTNSITFTTIDFPNANEILLGVLAVFTFLFILISNLIFKKRLVVIKEKTVLKDMLADYQSALIVRYAMLDIPAFVAICTAIYTGGLYFLLYAVLIIGVFIYYAPGKERLKNDLELNQTESTKIDDPEAMVAEMNTGNYTP